MDNHRCFCVFVKFQDKECLMGIVHTTGILYRTKSPFLKIQFFYKKYGKNAYKCQIKNSSGKKKTYKVSSYISKRIYDKNKNVNV